MNLARLCVAAAGILLAGGGYFASQAAFFGGTTAQYTQSLDASPLPILSLVLLLAAIALAFVPDKEDKA